MKVVIDESLIPVITVPFNPEVEPLNRRAGLLFNRGTLATNVGWLLAEAVALLLLPLTSFHRVSKVPEVNTLPALSARNHNFRPAISGGLNWAAAGKEASSRAKTAETRTMQFGLINIAKVTKIRVKPF